MSLTIYGEFKCSIVKMIEMEIRYVKIDKLNQVDSSQDRYGKLSNYFCQLINNSHRSHITDKVNCVLFSSHTGLRTLDSVRFLLKELLVQELSVV
ncbi:hypothetical protein HHI36_014872 [Cryptolaemus montrouzieri]|uniref:Uncharacterized protein n=1 Tax=Cryptolaemus montrouzieri TaxID=559131 RepID=A0ABD2N4A0_9CUCU